MIALAARRLPPDLRFPRIIDAGAAVLAYTAAHMIVSKPWLQPFFGAEPAWRIAAYVVAIVGVLGLGHRMARRAAARRRLAAAAVAVAVAVAAS